ARPGPARRSVEEDVVEGVAETAAYRLAVEYGRLIGSGPRRIGRRGRRRLARGHVSRYAKHHARRHHVVEAELHAAVPAGQAVVDGRGVGPRCCEVDGTASGIRRTEFAMGADIESGPIVIR